MLSFFNYHSFHLVTIVHFQFLSQLLNTKTRDNWKSLLTKESGFQSTFPVVFVNISIHDQYGHVIKI